MYSLCCSCIAMDLKYIETCIQTNNLDFIEIDMNKHCRTCLLDLLSTEVDLFSKSLMMNDHTKDLYTIAEVVERVTGQNVRVDDGLPPKICRACLKTIYLAYNFKQQSKKIDNVLKNYVSAVNPSLYAQSESVNVPPKPEQLPIVVAPAAETVELFVVEMQQPSPEKDNGKCNDEHGLDSSEEDSYHEPEPAPKRPKKQQATVKKPKDKDESLTMNASSGNFECGQCRKVLGSGQSLSRHMKIHKTDVVKRPCPHCDKLFARADDLKRHIRTHTNERPYECTECPKSFKQSGELKEHLNSHSRAMDFSCELCPKKFATRNGYYVHMKTHTNNLNHECSECPMKYTTSWQLTQHMGRTHKTTSYPCTVEGCDKVFTSMVKLNDHKKVCLMGKGEKKNVVAGTVTPPRKRFKKEKGDN